MTDIDDTSHSHSKGSGTSTARQTLPKTGATITAHGTRIAALEAANIALEARVKALESPTPPPPPPPPPVIVPKPIIDLQGTINSAVAGSIIDCSGSAVFKQIIDVNKPLTLLKGTVDTTGLGVPLQSGGITISANDVVLDTMRSTGSGGSGLRVGRYARCIIRDCELDNNIQEGYNVSEATDLTFLRTHIHHNNVARTVDSGWEAGGGKAHGTNIIFDGCESNHNGGPGIWFDQWYPSPFPANRAFNSGTIVRNCRVHDNGESGIMYEVSDGAKIYNNVVWNNGNPNAGWVWAAGILISSSRNVEVYGNTVAWNLDGISVTLQNRADRPGNTTNVFVHDNNIMQGADKDASDKAMLAFAQDWAGGMYDTASNNRAAANRYWSMYPEPRWARFVWNGSLDTLAKLNATPAGGASTYLTTAEKNTILTNNGVPITY
jgi:hypothetical protein